MQLDRGVRVRWIYRGTDMGWHLTDFVPRFLGQRHRRTGVPYSTWSWHRSKTAGVKVKEKKRHR